MDGWMDVRTDGRLIVIIVQTQGSCNKRRSNSGALVVLSLSNIMGKAC